MKSLHKVFSIFTAREKRSCAVLILCMAVGAMLETAGVAMIWPLIKLMGWPCFLSEHAELAVLFARLGIVSHRDLVIAAATFLIGVYLAKNLYLAWQAQQQIKFALTNQVYYSSQLMASYLAKPYLFHVGRNTAKLMRNVNQAGNIFSSILVPLFQLMSEAATSLAIWLLLIFFDVFTALVVAVLLGAVLFAVLRGFRPAMARQGSIRSKCSTAMNKWASQGLGSIKETKVMRKERFFGEMYAASYEQYGVTNNRYMFLNRLPRLIIETVLVSGLLTLIIVKLALGGAPDDVVPLLGVLALAAFRIMPSISRIVKHYNDVKFHMPLFHELYPELIAIKERKELGKNIFATDEMVRLPFEREIRIEGLSFQYPDDQKKVLEDVSLVIPKGAFVGIVGPSGAGKTTFVDILLGLLPPTVGCFTVDGQDIGRDGASLAAWQANLAYVPQSIYLIDGTIRENIALGVAKNDIDEARLTQVIEMAELAGYVDGLKKGVDTKVGERGAKLSGGQRQRIGIARALYQQPAVLVLDEATSALDNATEKNITNTILKLKGRITIIAIAHRVSTLAACDFKIHLADGCASVATRSLSY